MKCCTSLALPMFRTVLTAATTLVSILKVLIKKCAKILCHFQRYASLCYSPQLSWELLAALQRKSHFCIPFLGIARPQSQFPHLCVCDRFIYSRDRSTYFLQQNIGRSILGIYCINRSQTHECGNWDCAIPFLGIFVSNFRYWFFAVCGEKEKYS